MEITNNAYIIVVCPYPYKEFRSEEAYNPSTCDDVARALYAQVCSFSASSNPGIVLKQPPRIFMEVCCPNPECKKAYRAPFNFGATDGVRAADLLLVVEGVEDCSHKNSREPMIFYPQGENVF